MAFSVSSSSVWRTPRVQYNKRKNKRVGFILIFSPFHIAISGDYFTQLDASSREEQPELTKGSIEFIAPDYMVRPLMPQLYFFLIDVSISAVRSGMLEVFTFS